MAIRDWTPRTIRRLWVVAAAIQLALVLPWAIHQYRLRHSAPPLSTDSLPGLFSSVDSARRASALAMLRDSLGIVLEVRGDTITDVSLTPEGASRARQLAASVDTAVAQFSRVLLPLLIVVLTIEFSPTLVAVLLTACWFWLRRGHAQTAVLPDV